MDDTQKQQRIAQLTDEERTVTQEKGTEAPFSGAYWNTTDHGMYTCKVCGATLFRSDAKFVTTLSGLAGWPSFDQAIPDAVVLKPDDSMGMHRTEVLCKTCGAHLGHLFEEKEEASSGNHFCINSCSLDFQKE